MIDATETLEALAYANCPKGITLNEWKEESFEGLAGRYFPEICDLQEDAVVVQVVGEGGEIEYVRVEANTPYELIWRPLFVSAGVAKNGHGILRYGRFLSLFDNVLPGRNMYHEDSVRKAGKFRYIEGESGLCLETIDIVPDGRIVAYAHSAFVQSQDTMITVYSLLSDGMLQRFMTTTLPELPRSMQWICKLFIAILNRISK